MARLIHAGHGPRSVVLIRLLVGAVFLAEGIQKFLFPATLGVGRFVQIGLPAPEFLAPFVGVVEIICGALLIVGLLDAMGGGAAPNRHDGGDHNNQDPDAAFAGILGNGARGADRMVQCFSARSS